MKSPISHPKALLYGIFLLLVSLTGFCQTAIDFDGSNDYLKITSMPALNAFTIEMWAYWQGGDANYDRYLSTVNNGLSFEFNQASGQMNFVANNWGGYGRVSTSYVLPQNTWVHIAWVWAGSTSMDLYINGSFQETLSGITGATTVPSQEWWIGNNQANGSEAANYIVDEFRVWNLARSSGDISTNYTKCLTGSENGMEVYYQFEDGIGTSVTDLSPNARTGTLMNMTGSEWVTGYNCTSAGGGIFQGPATYVSSNTVDPQAVVKAGNYLFTGHWGGGNPFKSRVEAYDVSSGTPVYVGQTDLGSLTGDANNGAIYDMEVANGYLYVTARYGEKLYIVDYTNPASLSVVGYYHFGVNTIPADIVVESDYSYVTVDQGLKIIDISNPSAPSLAGSLSFGAWVDVRNNISKNANYLYVSGNNSIYVVDVTNPASPSLSQTIPATGVYRNMLQGNYLYVIKSTTFLVYDVSTPASPSYQAEVTVPNISSLTELNSDGTYLFLSANTSSSAGTVSLYDLSTPASPTLVEQSESASKNPMDMEIGPSYVYTVDQNSDQIGAFPITYNCVDPVIDTNPSASTSCEGESTSFSVTASGTALTYQWRENGSDISNGGVYSGVTSATLNISDVTGLNGKSYDVVVTESGTCSSTSATAALTVNTIPTITGTAPAARLCEGSVTLGATASAGIVNWYTAASGGSSLGTGTSFSTPSISTTTTYYVDATENGCISGSRTAVNATINPLSDQTYGVSANTVNEGESVDFTLDGSQTDVNYYLRNDANDTLFAGPIAGTGSTIVINTGVLNETITFNVYQEHVSTNCFAEMTQGTQIITVISQSLYYVDAGASGSNDGSNWANAYTDLQSALTAANAGDTIVVAAGSYIPSVQVDTDGDGVEAKEETFAIPTGVKVYGGFAGSEDVRLQSSFDNRDFATNRTILSGDLNGDSAPPTVNTGATPLTITFNGTNTDNAYHVVSLLDAENVVLDGFTIQYGHDNNDKYGGGVYADPSDNGTVSAVLKNLELRWNKADRGAAIGGIESSANASITITLISSRLYHNKGYNYGVYHFQSNATGSSTVINCEIFENRTDYDAAGFMIITPSADFKLINSLVSGNHSNRFYGGMSITASNATIINSTVVNNYAHVDNTAGISFVNSPNAVVRNTIAWGNNQNGATDYQVLISGSSLDIQYSLVQYGSAGFNGGQANFTSSGNNLSSDPLFLDDVSGDFSLQNGSPAKDSGDTASLPADEFDLDGDANTVEPIPFDLAGNARTIGTTDMGAYENSTSNSIPTLTAFATAVGTGNEDTEIAVTFASMQTAGDQNDPDGTVDAFRVTSIASGTLKIGTSSGAATAYAASTNDLINATLNAYWTPAANANGAGTNAFEVVAVDNEGAESTPAIMANVDVSTINDAPVFTASGDVTVAEDFETTETVTITPGAVPDDEAGQTVTYSLSPASVSFADVSINASTGEITISAVADSVGTQLFSITADDAQGVNNTHSETFTLTVTAVNDAPAFTTSGDVSVLEDFGTTETVTITPADVPQDEAGQSVTYSLSPTSVNFADVSINASTGEVTINAVADSAGVQLFIITADDGQGANNTQEQTFTLTVSAQNDDPTIGVNNGLVLDEGAILVITTTELSASDVDNAAVELTFNITSATSNGIIVRASDQSTGISSFLQSEIEANEILYKHDDSETTSDSFNFTVSDNAGGSTTTLTFNITVNSIDDTAPELTTLSPADAASGVATSGATFDITFNEDMAKGSGSIDFRLTSDNGLIGSVNVTSGDVSIVSATASITPSFDLPCAEDIYITFGSGVFEDLNANDFAGLAAGNWNFVTNNPPVIIGGAISVTENTNCGATGNGVLDATNAIELDGSASAAGNYSFQWYEGVNTAGASAGTTASISTLASGNYTLVVTHNTRACESAPVTATVTSNFADPPVITPGVTDVTSCSLANGSVSATASSTSEPADYTFNVYSGSGTGTTPIATGVADGVTGFSKNSLADGIYTIEVINNSTECSSIEEVLVNDNTVVPVINPGKVNISNLTECGTDDGAIGVAVAIEEGGVSQDASNYTFTWYEGSGTGGSVIGSADTLTNLAAGDYTLEFINNGSGCGSIEEFVIVVEDQTNPTVVTQNITVQLDTTGNVSITPAQVDNGSADACGIASLSLDQTDFSCNNVGTNEVTLTVTDNNGNENTATALVTVEDHILPAAITQNITVQLDTTGNVSITPAQVDNGSADACGIATLSLNQTDFTCNNVGTNEVTLTITDNNGNENTATALVTVEDHILPAAITQNITVQLDTTGNVSITPAQVDNGSADACGIASLSLDQTDFSCNNVGTNEVTLTVTDNNGNENTATAVVTVEDHILPAAVTQNITVQLDTTGNVSITPAQVDNGSADACGIASLSLDLTAFSCNNVGTNEVTLTVTDNNGNENTASAIVTVEDKVLPAVVTSDLDLYLDDSGLVTVLVEDIDNGSFDACGLVSTSIDTDSFDCTDAGTPQPIVLTVIDNNGNENTSTAWVLVSDTISPVALAKDISIFLGASGEAFLDPSMVENGSTDNCEIDSSWVSIDHFDCSDIGSPVQVELIIQDHAANFGVADASITVLDTISPVALAQNITVQLDTTGSVSITPAQVDNGSADACGIANLSLDVSTFSCEDIGTNEVILTVTDNNGNANTTSAVVTVEDNVLPAAITQNITVQLDTTGSVSITPAQVDNGSADACGIASLSLDVSTFSCEDIGTNEVILTVTDNNGNANTTSALVTVEDHILPAAITQNITVQLDTTGSVSITPAQVDNGSFDACGIANLSLDVSTFSCENIGVNEVTLTVTDNNGNANTASAVVTVEDNILPAVITQNITVQLDTTGIVSITPAQVDNGSTDACGIASLSLDVSTFSCENIGVNEVTLTVTDNNGNENTASAVVTVEDNILPAVITQNITVQLDTTGSVSITPAQVDNGSTDACGIASLSLDVSTFSCENIGVNEVTLTVTDNNGNENTASAVVTVEDNILPAVITQNITVQLDTTGSVSITPAQVDNGSFDACGIASLSLDESTFSCEDIGTNEVILTVTDNNENANTTSAVVTVEDHILPAAITQNITVQLDTTGSVSITPAQVDNGSYDACGIASLSLDESTFSCENIGTNEVTLTVTDNSGNENTASAIVTVQDNILPAAITQNISVEIDQEGMATITVEQVDNGSFDACGIASRSLNVYTWDCSFVGTTQEVTLSVTDNNGNINSTTAEVTITDDTDPVFSIRAATVYLNDDGVGGLTLEELMVSQEDCLDLELSQTDFSCADVGEVEVTVTATDGGGNVTAHTTIVTVNDDASKPNFEIVTTSAVQCEGTTINMIPVSEVMGTAAQFPDRESYIIAQNTGRFSLGNSRPYTIEMWFNSEWRGPLISSMAGDNFSGIEIICNTYTIRAMLKGTSQMVMVLDTEGGGSVVPNTWNHLAFIYDGQSYSIVINGIDQNIQNAGYNLTETIENNTDFRIGNSRLSSFGGDDMAIDEVRIWGHARTLQQINSLKDIRLSGGEGLLLHYNFESVSDDIVKDHSPYKNSGRVIGNTQLVERAEQEMDTSNYTYEWLTQVDYRDSKTISFDGSNDHLAVRGGGGLSGLSRGSIEMWVRWNEAGQDGGFGGIYGAVLARQRDNVYSNNIIGLDNSDPSKAHIIWRPFDAYRNVIVSNTTLDYQWHHLVISFEPGMHKMYLDGNLIGSASFNGAMRHDRAIPLTIGAWTGGGASYAKADIDEFRVWDRVLDGTEVVSNMGGLDPAASHEGLSLYYDFQGQFESGLAQDKSGHNQSGEPRNGVSASTRKEMVSTNSAMMTQSVDFSITQAMYHKIRVTNRETGCSAIDSVLINMGVNSKPQIRSNRNPIFCDSTPNMILAMADDGGNGATSFQWYKDGYKINGASASNLNVTTPGKYSLEIMNTSGCPVISNTIEVKSGSPKGKILGEFNQYVCNRELVLEVEHENGSSFQLQYYNSQYRNWYNYGSASSSSSITIRNAGYYYRVAIRSAAGCITYTNYIAAYAGASYNAYIVNMQGGRLAYERADDGSWNSIAFTGSWVRSYYSYNTTQMEYLWVREGTEVGNERSLRLDEAGTYRLIIKDKRSGCESESAIVKVYNGPTVTLESEGGETESCTAGIKLTATIDATAEQLSQLQTYWIVNGKPEKTNSNTMLAAAGKYEYGLYYKGNSIYSNTVTITKPSLRTYLDKSDFYYCPPYTNRPGYVRDRYFRENRDKGAKYFYYVYNGGWRYVGWNDKGILRITRPGYYGFYTTDECGNRTGFEYTYVRMNYCGRWYDENQAGAPVLSDTTQMVSSIANTEGSEPIDEIEGGPDLIHVSLSPQPAEHLVTIDILSSQEEDREEVSIQLLDVSGRLLKTAKLNSMYGGFSQSQIDVSDLAGGVYLYRIQSSDLSIKNGRFIITRK
ncbi:LamG-like jellyroll fold domain-containing protein [Marinoscillum sp.]|uniref:LamG-like jellyroll fold domain-containing protein n=1 Tax=Marinoscillum sp. TaxID=2024838 RepID=UPI003BA94B1F